MRPQRLIDTHTCQLVDFSQDANVPVPPYAILSHRWLHGEEVTFQEFLKLQHEPSKITWLQRRWGEVRECSSKARHDGTKKSGYRKILAACKQARNDKLNFIWIDTCCINQSNPQEVARNIESMYSYYRNSEVCYAYLADVLVAHRVKSPWPGKLSEWFQRAWTLQELVAPRKVVFFNTQWKRIGDKHRLKNDIHDLTGIPTLVLEGTRPMEDVEIQERMSWCAGRKTTYPADLAYCLSGILGVSIVPNYSEDVETAFARLQNALVLAYPENFKKFGDRETIYSMLVRRNARARVSRPFTLGGPDYNSDDSDPTTFDNIDDPAPPDSETSDPIVASNRKSLHPPTSSSDSEGQSSTEARKYSTFGITLTPSPNDTSHLPQTNSAPMASFSPLIGPTLRSSLKFTYSPHYSAGMMSKTVQSTPD